MQPQMRFEIAFLKEGFTTRFIRTNEISHAIVLLDVHLEPLRSAVRLPASLNRANEVLCFQVSLDMVL